MQSVSAAKILDLSLETFADGGFLLERFETAAFFGERGGGFAELEMGLVDEGLFLLELGFE